ncbi:MAG TPA: tetratricopeptide repeat protein [Terracidiphilus sp.]|nr:tetratricopeptide repeat protein [Terracidiphilus sp.]
MHQLRKARAFLIASLIAWNAVAQAPGRFDAISAALADRSFPKALELLQPALKASPSDPRLWAMQGAAHAGMGDNKEALASFQRSLKIAPGYLPALRGAAQIEFGAGSDAAIPLLERILRAAPTDLTAHGMLAVLEYQLGDCAAALPHFEQAASLFASKPAALHAYAACLVKQRRLDEAAEVLRRSVASNPEDARERQVLASIQLMAQHPQGALVTLSPLLTGNSDVRTLELASQSYEQAHDTQRAVDTLRQAILLDPADVNLYVDFAAISARHQSMEVGIQVVNDGINLQPRAAPLYFARGMLYVQLSEYEKAQEDFDAAYKLDPMQSLTAAAQGLTAVQQNDLERALAGVRDKLAARPNDPILLYLQADVLSQQDPDPGTAEFESALNSAKRAAALNPSLGPAHTVLAKLYMVAEQYQDAAAECRKALVIDPTDQTALYYLIRASRKTDQSGQIPNLLKQYALLRQQAANKKREDNRFKLAEDDSESK